jgi:hypothetical protein
MIFPVDLKGLTAECQDETHAFFAQPEQRRMRLRHQDLRQLRVREPLRHSHHVAVKVILSIFPHIRSGLFLGCQIGDERLDVVHTSICAADNATGEIRIAPPEIFWSFLQHQGSGPSLAGRNRSA